MSYLLTRTTHFAPSELPAIHRDEQHGLYNGFRNTFDEWQTKKARSDDPLPEIVIELEEEGGEDELERARR
jgi:hypothetical protein